MASEKCGCGNKTRVTHSRNKGTQVLKSCAKCDNKYYAHKGYGDKRISDNLYKKMQSDF